jgi:hypothetical protein
MAAMAASLEVLLILVSSETTAHFTPSTLVVSTPRRSFSQAGSALGVLRYVKLRRLDVPQYAKGVRGLTE